MRNAFAQRASYDDITDIHLVTERDRAAVRGPMPSESDLPTLRPSGVRRANASIHEILNQAGDSEPATIVAGEPREEMERRVPIVVAPDRASRDLVLDARARWLLPFIDGATPLALLLETSGMPRPDAVEAFCALLELEIVALI